MGIGEVIGGATGAIGGLVGGLSGTPDQVTNTNQTSSTTLANKSNQQRQLEANSYQQYLKQLEAVNLQQQAATETDPFRQAALQQQLQLLNGQGFAPTAQEQQQIQAIRDAQIGQGTADINRYTDESLRKVVSGAAGRGLRGQALGQLQGDVIDTGAQQLGNLVNQANLTAAQNAINLPQNRLTMQNQAAQSGLTYAQQLQQQALNNRTTVQNPYLLTQLQNERLQTGTTNQVGSNVTPGQKGSIMGGILGAAGGALSGATTGGLLQGAFGGGAAAAPKPSATTGNSYMNFGGLA